MNELSWRRDDSASLTDIIRRSDEQRERPLETISSEKYIALARESMGMMERFKFDRKNRKALAEHATQVASMMLTKQRSMIEQQMTYEAALAERAALEQYQIEVKHLDIRLQKSLNEIEQQISSVLVDHLLTMRVGKKHYHDEFQALVDNGALFQEDADELNFVVKNVTNKVSSKAYDRFILLLESYGKTYEEAITLLKGKMAQGIT